MKRLKALSRKLDKIDEGYFIRTLFADQRFKDLIIRLNTEDQLYNQGIDSLGRSLGHYAENTIIGTSEYEGKAEKGQRYDHVTLNDTGAFYASFRVRKTATGFKITAKTDKGDTDLIDDWGADILGLTEENMQKIIDIARLIIVPKMREHLLKQAA